MICILVLDCWSVKPHARVSPDYSRRKDVLVLCPETSGTILHIGHTTHDQKAPPRLSVSGNSRIQGNNLQMMVERGLERIRLTCCRRDDSLSSTYQITKPNSTSNQLAVLHPTQSHAHTLRPRDRNKRSWTSIQSNSKLPGSLGSLYSHPPTARIVQSVKKTGVDVLTFIWIIKIHGIQAEDGEDVRNNLDGIIASSYENLVWWEGYKILPNSRATWRSIDIPKWNKNVRWIFCRYAVGT